jgi:hypothetical protein
VSRQLVGRITSVLFAFAAIAFALFVAWSAVRFPVNSFLPSMQRQYALRSALLLFIEALLPLAVAAVAVAASLSGSPAAGRAAGGAAQPFGRTAGSAIVAFVLFAVGYAALFEVAAPAARRRLADMEYRSTLARGFKARAEKARRDGDWIAARDALVLYMAIDKGDKAMAALKLEAEAEAVRRAPPAKPAVQAAAPAAEVDAAAYVAKARAYFEKEDWLSAHFYASQAAAFDPSRTDAPRLASQAWQKIVSAEPPAGDRQAVRLHREKLAAYRLVETEPVAAYYSFLDLAARYPKDQDIRQYLAESARRAKSESFLLHEVDGLATLPGQKDVLFMNGVTKDAVEAVLIGTLVDAGRQGVYAVDIEAVRYRPTGEVLWHLRAPFGRIDEAGSGAAAVGRRILLRGIDEADRTRQTGPTYLAGSRPAAERNFLLIEPTTAELAVLSSTRDSVAAMGLPELWRLRERLPGFGMLRGRIDTEIVMKAFMPLAFLVLQFLALAFGWALRARWLGRPPVPAYLAMPLVPAAAAVAGLLYVHAHRIVLGFTVLAFGLTPALVVGAVLSLVLLVVALIVTAGQAG